MKFKLILVALLLAFLVAVCGPAVSAADDAITESVSADDAIDSVANNEVLGDGQLGAGENNDVWIDDSKDESIIYVEGKMKVVDHNNPSVVLLTGASASRNTTYSDTNSSSVESKVIEESLGYAKMMTGATDIEVTKIDRNVSTSMFDHRVYHTIVDNVTKRVTHLVTGSYAKITTVNLNMVAEYNREDQKLIETKLAVKYDANTKNIIATVKDVNGKPVSGLKVGFALNGVKYIDTDANGQAKYSTADLADGTYKATVRAYGNEIYKNSSKETVTFTIGSKEKSKIFLRNALYFVTQTKLVQVTLWDGNNQPLANKTVYIRAYDSIWHGVTDENGDAFVRVGIGFGTHDATVGFDGDDQYNASTRDGYIRVIKQTPSVMVRGADTMFKASDNNKVVKVHLRDRYDKALPEGSKIVLKLNGKTYVGTTDINGVASIKISINTVGTFTAQAMYGGNTAFNAVTRDVKIRIV